MQYTRINHDCHDEDDIYPPKEEEYKAFYKIRKFWYSLILMSKDNHRCPLYFKSERSIRNGRKKQYNSTQFLVIHPLSNLATIYDVYLFFLYIVAIFLKTVDSAFVRRTRIKTGVYKTFIMFIFLIDALSWINITFMFFRGVIVPHEKKIILKSKKIFLYRIKSPIFWAEVVSSLPKYALCTQTNSCIKTVWVIFNFASLFKIFLIQKTVNLLKVNMENFNINKRLILTISELFLLLAFLTHSMSCMVYAVPRFRRTVTGSFHPDTWLLVNDLVYNSTLSWQYFMSFFKASAQTFGIHIKEFKDYPTWEETILNLINYFVGKIIHIMTWITVLHVLMNQKPQKSKFQEMIMHVKGFLDTKEVPENIQKRVISLYKYYYRGKYLGEMEFQKLLPNSLEAKTRISQRKMLKNTKIFSKLSDEEIEIISKNLISQIFLPNDIIVSSGMNESALYLLESGAVAVYSHSGREICHLADGSFFGELSLISHAHKTQASVIALETTKLLKLEKIYFDKYLRNKREVIKVLEAQAKDRRRQIKKLDENYQNILFQQMLTNYRYFQPKSTHLTPD